MHAGVSDVAVGANNLGAGLEGLRNAHGLDSDVYAQAVGGEGLNLLDEVRVARVDLIGCAQLQCLVHAVVVEVDGDDATGTAEVSGHNRAPAPPGPRRPRTPPIPNNPIAGIRRPTKRHPVTIPGRTILRTDIPTGSIRQLRHGGGINGEAVYFDDFAGVDRGVNIVGGAAPFG